MMEQGFETTSYDAHKEHAKKHFSMKRLEEKDAIDYWLHERIYNSLSPFLNKSGTWLTVGDGIGTDANWLKLKGEKVMASDISDNTLKTAKELGYIDEYSTENAEKLSFQDDEFDFVLCKEAFHHFPRPYLAVYEMLRVSKQGIILVEPVDIAVQMPAIIFLKNILDKFSTKLIDKVWKNRYSFESVGNYVYKTSEREIEKIAMGINLPYVAFKGINTYHTTKFDMHVSLKNKKVHKKVKNRIAFRNLLSKLGIIPYSMNLFLILHKNISPEILKELHVNKFKVVELKRNPYL